MKVWLYVLACRLQRQARFFRMRFTRLRSVVQFGFQIIASEAKDCFWIQFGRTMRTGELHVSIPQRFVFCVLAGGGVKPLRSPDLVVHGFEPLAAMRALRRCVLHGFTLYPGLRSDRDKANCLEIGQGTEARKTFCGFTRMNADFS